MAVYLDLLTGLFLKETEEITCNSIKSERYFHEKWNELRCYFMNFSFALNKNPWNFFHELFITFFHFRMLLVSRYQYLSGILPKVIIIQT